MTRLYQMLNFFGGYTQRISEDVRSKLRIAVHFLIFFIGLCYASFLSVHLLVKCAVGALLMGVMILLSIQGTVKPVKWDRTMTILWFSLGGIRLLSAMFVSIEFFPMALIWIIGFPLLFLVWNDRKDYPQLFLEMAAGENICALILILGSILLIPIVGGEGYRGLTLNPNGLGQWITASFPCALYLHYAAAKEDLLKKWLYRAELFAMLYLTVATQSRTTLLAISGMSLMLLILWIVSSPKEAAYWGKRAATGSICLALTFIALTTTNRLAATNNPLGEWYLAMQDGEAIPADKGGEEEPGADPGPAAGDPGSSSGGGGAEEADPSPAPVPADIQTMVDGAAERLRGDDKEQRSLADYTSGRTLIWQFVLERINVLGHPSREHIVTRRNGDMGANAHNIVMQMVYSNGIFAGIVYALIMLYSGILLLKKAFIHKNIRNVYSFALIIHTGFFLTGMLTNLNLPFLYLIEYEYYLTFPVIFSEPDPAHMEIAS